MRGRRTPPGRRVLRVRSGGGPLSARRPGVRALAASAVVSVALVFLVAWLFGLKLERAVALAPVIVVVVGGIAALLVLWARVLWESLRTRRHPWRIVALAVLALAAIAVAAQFVGPLPRE